MNMSIEFKHNRSSGLTLIELMIVIAIIGILAAFGTLGFQAYVEKAKIKDATAEIASIQTKIAIYYTSNGFLPDSLSEIKDGNISDPWGNPYQYSNFAIVPQQDWRKDRNLHPINTDYDLWSMGKDGKTHKTLTAKNSRDDVIRANDGSYIGLAEAY